jgi:predicted alpha-1,2-mannosidase
VGTGSGAWLVFPEGTTTVKMALAVSYVDPDGARANLDAEHPDFDAAARLADTEAAWRAELGRVRVRGGTDAERVTFHTALYHALFMPTRFTDIDGRYRGLDGEVHTAEFDYLTDLSLWDTFRTLHSLWNLAWPDHQRSVLTSLVQMVEDGGSLPRWPLAHGYTSGMVGTPAQQLFAESAQKGLTGWDEDAAFEVASFVSFNGQPHASRDGLASYLDLGYVSRQASGTSASLTLEYVWSDHAMQQWALHRSDDVAAASFAELADNWKNQWNPDAGFFLGRNADGSFPEFEPGDEEGWTSDFVEGNAWHYRYGVPFDVAGQIELQAGGDRAAWLADYATYWDNVRDEPDDALPDTYYWHGNEPVMHYAFLGSLADAPDLTADAARWVLANRYGPEADGLDGNDDSGTLSSWFALAAMGAFPIAGTDVYALSSPLFERVEIDTDWGELVIRAPGTSDVARYVAAARLGEAPLTSASFTHDEWVTAGELVFEMSATPGAWPDGVDD